MIRSRAFGDQGGAMRPDSRSPGWPEMPGRAEPPRAGVGMRAHAGDADPAPAMAMPRMMEGMSPALPAGSGGSGGHGSAAYSAGEGVGLAEFGAILRRRWITIALSLAATLVLAILFLAVTKPIYSASTQVFVDPRNRAAFVIEGLGSGAGYDPNLVDSQVVLIESDTVLRRVVEAEKLGEDSEFARGDGEARANALRNLKDATKVRRPDRTYIVEIEVRTQSAEKSARLANAIARAYLSDGRDSKSETNRREESWLDKHLGELQRRLREAEDRVEKFKIENRIVGVEGRTTVEQRLSELNKGMVEAQRRTADARATMEQADQLRRTGRLPDATGEALRSAAVERLRGQLAEVLRLEANARSTLGPRHPAALEIREQVAEARRQLNEELNRIGEAARSAFNVARANEAGLERQVDQLKRETSSTSQTLVQLRDLERAVEAQKAVYTKFLSDKEQIARLTVDTPAGRVIAPATPPDRKAFPNKALILALAFVAGLMLGVGLALVFETIAAARRGGRTEAVPDMPPVRTPAPLPAMQPAWQAPARVAPAPVAPASAQPAPASLAAHIASAPALSPAHAPAMTNPAQVFALVPPQKPGRRDVPNRPDAVRIAPHSDYARAIDAIALRILGMERSDRQPLGVMLVAGSMALEAKTLSANLAFALQARGETVLLMEANPQLPPLNAQVPKQAARFAMPLYGAKQLVTPLPGADALGPFLLLPGTSNAWAAIPATPARPPTIVLVDGPAIGSPALVALRLERRLDGVIIVDEPGKSPNLAALPAQFSSRIIGSVAQAA